MPTTTQHFVIVHIPKAAGSSLKTSISQTTAPEKTYFDYNKPLSMHPLPRKLQCIASSFLTRGMEQDVIFGHFMAGKYANLSKGSFCKRPGWNYIVFVRDPLQRAMSHYYFWKRTDDSQHKVWRRFSRENWSLERFLLSPEHENFMSQYLWRFPISNFDFIGITERFEESIQLLGGIFPALEGLSFRTENTNPDKIAADEYTVPPDLAEAFRQRNAADYAIYDLALQLFEQQKQRFMNNENT
jgi:hypothetical protein